MKFRLLLILTIWVSAIQILPLTSRGQGMFGNSPDGTYGYGIYASYPNPYISGVAVSFTPTVDFSFSSVTLTLSNYTQPFGLQLLEGTNLASLVLVGNFDHAPTNNGSAAPFTFNSVSFGGVPMPFGLDTNETYWLFAYGSSTSSGTIQWQGGTAPSGLAFYNGTALYQAPGSGFLPGLHASSPTFSINPVPEPGTTGLALLFVVVLAMVRRGNRNRPGDQTDFRGSDANGAHDRT